MIGAGIATPIGICVETFVVKTTINKPALRAQFEEATIGRYIYETLRNIFATGCAGYFAKFIERLGLGSLAAMDMDITRAFEKLGVTAADFAVYALLKRYIYFYLYIVGWLLTIGVKSTESLMRLWKTSFRLNGWRRRKRRRRPKRTEPGARMVSHSLSIHEPVTPRM